MQTQSSLKGTKNALFHAFSKIHVSASKQPTLIRKPAFFLSFLKASVKIIGTTYYATPIIPYCLSVARYPQKRVALKNT